jgi:hypothetical protein
MGSLRSLLTDSKKCVELEEFLTFEKDSESTYPAYFFDYRGWHCQIGIRSDDSLKRTFIIYLLGSKNTLGGPIINGLLYQFDWLFHFIHQRLYGPLSMSYNEVSGLLPLIMEQFQKNYYSQSKDVWNLYFKTMKCRNPKDLETLYD